MGGNLITALEVSVVRAGAMIAIQEPAHDYARAICETWFVKVMIRQGMRGLLLDHCPSSTSTNWLIQ